MTLVTLTAPNSPAAEAYRTLRTNLIFAGLEQPLQTLLVTAPQSEDGKNQAIANLAVSLAQGGRTALLVDADLRQPHLHTLFEAPLAPGLSNLLADPSLPPPIQTTRVPGLSLLTAGNAPNNPADLFSARRLTEVVAALAGRADHVLFNAPPALAVSDAALLAAQLHGVLLVVRANHTRRDHTQRAKDLFEKIRVRVVGAVLV